jgi:hypothetical protein
MDQLPCYPVQNFLCYYPVLQGGQGKKRKRKERQRRGKEEERRGRRRPRLQDATIQLLGRLADRQCRI